MKIKHFNVNIVSIKQQQIVISGHTSSQYMKETHINVNIVNRNLQERIVSRDTYSQYINESETTTNGSLKANSIKILTSILSITTNVQFNQGQIKPSTKERSQSKKK